MRCRRTSLALLLPAAGLIGALIGGCAESAAPTGEVTPAVEPTPAPTESPAATHTPEAEPTAALPPSPTATPEAASLFAVEADAPILEYDSTDGIYLFAGPMLRHEGVLYAFFTAFGEDGDGPKSIGYATSADGVAWEQAHAQGILSSADLPGTYARQIAAASSVVIEPDGTWAMYLSVWEPEVGGRSVIFRATAPDADGPWAIHPTPVLRPGVHGEWDSLQVWGAAVYPVRDGYAMAYSGTSDSDTPDAIGIATSADGINWTKRGDPVLEPGEAGEWDADGITLPSVQRADDQWVMMYVKVPRTGDRRFGLAFSEDGFRWEKHPTNPVFTDEDVPDGRPIHTATMFCEEACRVLAELINPESHNSHLWLAEQQGSLAP